MLSSRSIFLNSTASNWSNIDRVALFWIVSDVFYFRFDVHCCYSIMKCSSDDWEVVQLLILDDEWHSCSLKIGSFVRIASRDLKSKWRLGKDPPLIMISSLSVESTVSDDIAKWFHEILYLLRKQDQEHLTIISARQHV